MTDARVEGVVTLRPVRLGIADKCETFEAVQKLATIGITYWGGTNFLALPISDMKATLDFATKSGIDAITTFDEQTNPEYRNISGFTYRNYPNNDPLDPGDVSSRQTPLKSQAFAGESPSRLQIRGTKSLTHVRWKETHPLNPLLVCMYGSNEIDFLQLDPDHLNIVELENDDPIPNVEWFESQLGITQSLLERELIPGFIGIACIREGNLADLVGYWNLRALGIDVIPWPLGHETLGVDFASYWLEKRIQLFDATHNLHVFGTMDSRLRDLLNEKYVAVVGESAKIYIEELSSLPTWMPDRYQKGTFSRSFSVEFDESAWSFKVPMPRMAQFERGAWFQSVGQVIADIQINATDRIPIGRGTALPLVRRHATDYLIQNFMSIYPICRPNENGFFVSIDAKNEYFDYPLVPSLNLSANIFDSVELVAEASDANGYATAMIKRLGGIGSESAALQPAIRQVLYASQEAPYGKPRSALIEEAKKKQGDWKDQLQFRRLDYPDWVLGFLSNRGLLQAVLKLRCLACLNYFIVSSELIADEVACTLCGDTRKIAFHISRGKPEWLLKFAGDKHLLEKLSETFPIMGAISLLSGLRIGEQSEIHFTTGTKISSPSLKCEIDLFLAFREDGSPIYVIGECKSYKYEFSVTDIENLLSIQQSFTAKGLECWILFATLRESLTTAEVQAFQSAFTLVQATSAFRSYRRFHDPIAPLIFTGEHLSVGRMSKESLFRKVVGPASMSSISIRTCTDSLGLVRVSTEGEGFRLEWGAPVQVQLEEA